jgi:electron transport complex protein RnfD
MEFPVIQIFTGGAFLGAVFLATDPITTHISVQGKVIFAVLFAMFTLVIRFATVHAEGVAFSILLANIFVPFIDSKTANAENSNFGKKAISVALLFVVATVAVVGLTMFTNASIS